MSQRMVLDEKLCGQRRVRVERDRCCRVEFLVGELEHSVGGGIAIVAQLRNPLALSDRRVFTGVLDENAGVTKPR